MDNKNDEFDNDKLPTIITIICVLFSFYLAFSTNMGNDYDNALRRNQLFLPPFMIIICFLISAINKDYKIFWSKKNIIIMIIHSMKGDLLETEYKKVFFLILKTENLEIM